MVVINSILGNGVDGPLFTDDLVIYITTRNQRVAARALQIVTNKLFAWAAERGLIFSTSKMINIVFRKKKKETRNQWKSH